MSISNQIETFGLFSLFTNRFFFSGSKQCPVKGTIPHNSTVAMRGLTEIKVWVGFLCLIGSIGNMVLYLHIAVHCHSLQLSTVDLAADHFTICIHIHRDKWTDKMAHEATGGKICGMHVVSSYIPTFLYIQLTSVKQHYRNIYRFCVFRVNIS